MEDQIKQQMQTWQNELDQLMARRQQLEQMQRDNEMSIQRHIGAITGAQNLLNITTEAAAIAARRQRRAAKSNNPPEPAVEPQPEPAAA